MQTLIAITANDIDPAGLAVDVALPASWISARLEDEQYRAESDGRFTGRLSRSGKADIVVRGTVEATVTMPCARCLMPAHTHVHSDIVLLLKPHAPSAAPPAGRAAHNDRRAKGPEYEFTSEEADQDEYDGETVVLDPFVRDAILLELPNFPLCSEACPGISRAPNNWPDARLAGPATPPAPPKANPFEALKHLRSSLAEGVPIGDAPLGTSAEANSIERIPEVTRGIKKTTNKKHETKIASTHAAPRRRASAKKTARAGKRK